MQCRRNAGRRLCWFRGDTTRAMAAACAGFDRKIPVVHLDAGLGGENIMSSFPEKANQRIVSQLAILQLIPTGTTRRSSEAFRGRL